jgi:hypothetical protein
MSDEIRMIIGTYTEGSSSKGIYLYSFNQSNAESKELNTIMSGNPSFIILSEDRKNFYSVNEFHTGEQAVSSFLIKENKMINLNKISCDFEGKSGADPCNLLLFQNYVISSNYTGGSFTLFELDENSKNSDKICQQLFNKHYAIINQKIMNGQYNGNNTDEYLKDYENFINGYKTEAKGNNKLKCLIDFLEVNKPKYFKSLVGSIEKENEGLLLTANKKLEDSKKRRKEQEEKYKQLNEKTEENSKRVEEINSQIEKKKKRNKKFKF